MSRYIDADALTEMLTKKLKTDYEMGLYNHGALTESFIRFVERQPTVDAVEVVRCKDCKYYDSGECVYHSEPKKQRMYERWTVDVNENDYCSCGERK